MMCDDRNPLHALTGAVGFIREQVRNGDSIFEDVVTIKSCATQMSRLIDDIMDWSKVSVGKLELQYGNVNLVSLGKQLVSV